MTIELERNLGSQQSLKRLKDFSEKMKLQYADEIDSVVEKWNDMQGEFELKAKGFKIKAKLQVFDDKVTVQLKMPLVLKAFEKEFERIIYSELKSLLQ